jgi:flagellar basal-body rod protein FlgG
MLLEMTRAAQAGLRQERQYEAIANHLANSGTTGFKKDVLSFDQMMKATLTTDFSVGDTQLTGNKLDLALTEKGFFKIQTPLGIRYTRNGNFSLNTNKQLITGSGDLVLGDAGPITIAGNNITINESGEVFSDDNLAGKLAIVNFDSYKQLKKDGANNYRYDGSPLDEKAAKPLKVVEGALEASNISVVSEMTKMIESNRMYETISKMMQTINELDGEATTMASAD